MIWNPEYETARREKIVQLQLRRLQSIVKWAYSQVDYYRRRLDEMNVSPRDIISLEDIHKLPLTEKEDLKESYPFGMFAVPLDRIVRVHASSGTTGRPIVVGYTKGDINTWAELVARVASAAGALATDVAQIAFGYGLFTGGFGLHAGLERIGATVVPISAGGTERQIYIMQDFGTTVLVSTPSYALHIAEVGEEMGIDFAALPLKLGLFGAEPLTPGIRREIEEKLAISATDNYGLTELMGPGVAGECEAKDGLHINEDHFLVEVVDPDTGSELPPGAEGELVFTTLTREAFPVLRFRSRDLSALDYAPCSCGRTTVRMKGVRSRTDDMLIIRGVNVFPSQIESVLSEIDRVKPHYLITVERKGGLDELEVQVEVSSDKLRDTMRELAAFENWISDRLHAVLGLRARVRLVEPKTLERTTGKTKRVIDRRPKD